MVSEKKIEFLVKQGFDKDVLKLFIDCGVDKHLFWFLSMQKNGAIEHLNTEDIKLINCYFEKTPSYKSKRTKSTYLDALNASRKFEKDEKRKVKNKIYNFKNGFYISILNSIDLKEEGDIMANCIGGYEEKVSSGTVGLLALKQANGKTVAHIEVNKNGLIGQNFSKANSKISKEYWTMILEFFENNSKAVDFSKLFGETYVMTCSGGNINEVLLTVPTCVTVFIENGVKKSEQNNGFEIKRFSPFKTQSEVATKINSKNEIIDLIEQKKTEIIKAYDDLTAQVLATTASKLYLSDDMKEKIFGIKKDAYKMKGEDYNLSETDPGHGINMWGEEMAEPQGQFLERMNFQPAPMNEVMENIVIPEPMRRPVVLLGRMRQEQTEQTENIEDEKIEPNHTYSAEEESFKEELIEYEMNEQWFLKVKQPQLDVEEIPYTGGYEAIAEAINGDIYGVEDIRAQQVYGGDEVGGLEGEVDEGIGQPESFNEIIRRAVRG